MLIQYQNQNITVFESALYRTTSCIIDLGNAVLIVDPNWLPNEVNEISNFVRKKYPKHQQYLLITHSDYDHIIGCGKFPNAQIIASHNLASNPNKSQIIQQIHDFDNEYYLKRDYNIDYPKVDIVIRNDMEKITVADQELVFFQAPGHCKDSLFMILPTLNCWISGDYLSNIEIPFIDYSYEQYVHTLKMAESIIKTYTNLDILINGHGDIAPSNAAIHQRIANDLKYLHLLKQEKTDNNIENQMNSKNHIMQYSNNPTLHKAHQTNLLSLQ
jgi:glyoxylase-like metal-dependent hydrolase (beta-lactamase superfamily II)